MSDLTTQHNGKARRKRALIKTRNPFKRSDRNNLPSLDDAFKENWSITASSDLHSTPTESDVNSRQSELSNKSLWFLSSPFPSSSPNASVLSDNHQGAVTGARRQMFEKFGFNENFSQPPSPISHPSKADWVLDLEENVSHLADNSFFEGDSDTCTMRSCNESSIYDVSQVGIDQSSSDFFEDVNRLKALATPEKNRGKVDEASRLERLQHENQRSIFYYDGGNDFERGLKRSETEEHFDLVREKASICSVCSDLGSAYDKKSPTARRRSCNEGNLPKVFGIVGEEKILAECAVRDILGLRSEWSLGVDEFSKLSIDETSEVNHVNVVVDSSSLYSGDTSMSPSFRNGFFSERHREMRRLGLFKISPIQFEKGKEMSCDKVLKPNQYTGGQSLSINSGGELFASPYSEADRKDHESDYVLSYICSDAPDSPTKQASIHPSFDDQHKMAEFDENKGQTVQDTYSQVISPRKKLFASQCKAPLERTKACSSITKK
jgi:hypothetical protein